MKIPWHSKLFTLVICVSHLNFKQFYHVPIHSVHSQLDGDGSGALSS